MLKDELYDTLENLAKQANAISVRRLNEATKTNEPATALDSYRASKCWKDLAGAIGRLLEAENAL